MVVVPIRTNSGTVKNLINPDEMDMEEVRAKSRYTCGHRVIKLNKTHRWNNRKNFQGGILFVFPSCIVNSLY